MLAIGVILTKLPFHMIYVYIKINDNSDGRDAVESKENGSVELKNTFKTRMMILPFVKDDDSTFVRDDDSARVRDDSK